MSWGLAGSPQRGRLRVSNYHVSRPPPLGHGSRVSPRLGCSRSTTSAPRSRNAEPNKPTQRDTETETDDATRTPSRCLGRVCRADCIAEGAGGRHGRDPPSAGAAGAGAADAPTERADRAHSPLPLATRAHARPRGGACGACGAGVAGGAGGAQGRATTLPEVAGRERCTCLRAKTLASGSGPAPSAQHAPHTARQRCSDVRGRHARRLSLSLRPTPHDRSRGDPTRSRARASAHATPKLRLCTCGARSPTDAVRYARPFACLSRLVSSRAPLFAAAAADSDSAETPARETPRSGEAGRERPRSLRLLARVGVAPGAWSMAHGAPTRPASSTDSSWLGQPRTLGHWLWTRSRGRGEGVRSRGCAEGADTAPSTFSWQLSDPRRSREPSAMRSLRPRLLAVKLHSRFQQLALLLRPRQAHLRCSRRR